MDSTPLVNIVLDRRKKSIDRCSDAIAFLAKLFPEFESIEEAANDLLSLLRKNRAKTIGIYVIDHIGMNPETFLPALTIAVGAIESKDEKVSFTRPAETIKNPIPGLPKKIKARKYTATRDLLCYAASLDPCTDDEEIERNQLIGYILRPPFSL